MIIQADARQIPLRDGCVQCVVTSPPYWGLRDYGTARWEGGDAGCDHVDPKARDPKDRKSSTLGGGVATIAAQDAGARAASRCRKCGAQRIDAQIGLEPTPDAYVAALVGVFREVRRVLADDGVLWVNLGDSYANTGSADSSKVGGFTGDRIRRGVKGIMDSRPRLIPSGLKPKDLVGIPWRVAFALQADGWYLRSDIIWSKPNPMPESVTDRPTKAHEYVFLLAKSERYYYDADSIAETRTSDNRADLIPRPMKATGPNDRSGHSQWETGLKDLRDDGLRNARSVWTITTKPYTGTHFATMPEKLAERCIKAGSKPGDLVLDPFGGSGTTTQVAYELNRRGVMLDLNMAYLDLAVDRTSELQPSLLEIANDR